MSHLLAVSEGSLAWGEEAGSMMQTFEKQSMNRDVHNAHLCAAHVRNLRLAGAVGSEELVCCNS